jgi:type VI protein secretion system component VasK
MTTLIRYLLLGLWTIVGTLGLTYVWFHWVSFLIPFPEAFWVWMFTQLPEFGDCESSHDLVMLIHLGLSFGVVVIGTWLTRRWVLARRRRMAGLR